MCKTNLRESLINSVGDLKISTKAVLTGMMTEAEFKNILEPLMI